jgi:hypothetical protein
LPKNLFVEIYKTEQQLENDSGDVRQRRLQRVNKSERAPETDLRNGSQRKLREQTLESETSLEANDEESLSIPETRVLLRSKDHEDD